MNQYFHSIRIDTEKCDGRMKCMRVCPTQAIRIRNRKAVIIEEKCIDCGECITVCPRDAIVPLTDPIGELSKFRHTVAMPSPALYAQFGREILPEKILSGIKKLGFDDAFDLAITCGEVSFAIQEYLREYKGPKPLISNVCPTVVRLIQVKYPELTNQIIPIEPPRELAAREIKKKKSKQLKLKEKEIGTFYLTPCPVKMISIKQPAEKGKSFLDGAISISDIYGPLLSAMEGIEKGSYRKALENICILGVGWAIVGGICRTLRLKNSLAVSGIAEILKVFNDIERGKLRNIDFVEAYSCAQGCVGGSLTVENVYISNNKILKLIETLEYEQIKACPDIREVRKLYSQNYFFIKGKFEPRPLKPLDKDIAKAIKKRKEKENIYKSLPKIDCGACGAPTCLTFAEDVVKGETNLAGCIINLSQKVTELPKELSGSPNTSASPSLIKSHISKTTKKRIKR
jgi:iron only hydrogenase large subunit-like protein